MTTTYVLAKKKVGEKCLKTRVNLLILHSRLKINSSQFLPNKLDSTKIVHCKGEVKSLKFN